MSMLTIAISDITPIQQWRFPYGSLCRLTKHGHVTDGQIGRNADR